MSIHRKGPEGNTSNHRQLFLVGDGKWDGKSAGEGEELSSFIVYRNMLLDCLTARIFPLLTSVEKAKLWRKGKDWGLPGVQWDGMNSGWAAFWGNGSSVYEAIMVDACHSASVQTHRMNTIKSEP